MLPPPDERPRKMSPIWHCCRRDAPAKCLQSGSPSRSNRWCDSLPCPVERSHGRRWSWEPEQISVLPRREIADPEERVISFQPFFFQVVSGQCSVVSYLSLIINRQFVRPLRH